MDVHAVESGTDTPAGDDDVLDLIEVALQEGGGPHRRLVTPIAGIVLDDLLDQRFDDPLGRTRPAVARCVGKSVAEVGCGAVAETVGPVVQGLTADAEAFGHVVRAITLSEPEQGLRPAHDAWLLGGRHQFPESNALPAGQRERSHGHTSHYIWQVWLILVVKELFATYLASSIVVVRFAGIEGN